MASEMEMSVWVTSVTVEKVPEDITEEVLRPALGRVERIDIDRPPKRAVAHFADKPDAMALLERGSFRVKDVNLKVYPMNGSILVTDLAKGISKDTLEMFFENERRSRGGDICRCIHKSSEGTAVITFSNPTQAYKVVDGPQLRLSGEPLNVTLYNPFKKPRTVSVRGISQIISKETVEMFFESKKRSGGGDIQSIEYKPDRGEAILTFVAPGDAEEVVSKGNFTLQNASLTVQWPTTKAKNIVKVTGLDPKTNKDTVLMYFESNKRSGGGPIRDIEHNPKQGTARITFEKATDAESVLSKKYPELKLENSTLQVFDGSEEHENKPSCAEGIEMKTLLVSGLKESTNTETVKMYFENTKRSGGGPISDVKRSNDGTSAVLTFVQAKDATTVLQKTGLTLEGASLHVSADDSDYDDNLVGWVKEPLYAALAVTAGEKSLSPEILSMYLENQTGGEVTSCQPADNGTYIVTFKEPQGASNVVKRSSDEQLQLNGTTLKARPLVEEVITHTHAIVVQGIPPSVSEDELKQHFENRSCSGGGVIVAMHQDADSTSTVITFNDISDAKRVIEFDATKGHTLKGHRVRVSMLKPPVLPPLITGPIEREKLLVTNISEDAEKVDLIDFLQIKSTHIIKTVVYSLKIGTALVEFDGVIDYAEIFCYTRGRPLCDQILSVQQVEVPDTIQVYGVAGCNLDTLSLYFENEKRSGGGPIKHTTISPDDDDCAIIQFENRKGLDKLVIRRHTLDRHNFTVRLYYEGLGVIPPGHNTSQPYIYSIPEDVVVMADPHVVAYIKSSHSHTQKIEAEMEAKRCNVIWPTNMHDDVSLRCTLERAELPRHGKQWTQAAVDKWNMLMNGYQRADLQVMVEAWNDFKQGLPTYQDSVKVFLDESSSCIRVAGEVKQVHSLAQKLRSLKDVAEQSALNRTSTVTEKISDLKKWQIDFLQKSQFENEMKSATDPVHVNIANQVITLGGNQEVIKKAKLRMYEIINDHKLECRSYSETFVKFLHHQRVVDRVNGGLKSLGVCWASEKQNVTVYASSDDLIQQAFTILDKAVAEVKLSIGKSDVGLVESGKWKHGKDIDIELDIVDKTMNPVIIIAAMSNEINRHKEAIEKFLSESSNKELKVPISYETSKLIHNHYLPTLGKLQSGHTGCSVDLHTSPTGPCIRIHGGQRFCETAKCEVEKLIKSFKTQDHHLSKPGMSNFFASIEGNDFIREQEAQYRVGIMVLRAGGAGSSAAAATKASYPEDVRVITHFTLSTGVRVSVVCGDATRHTAEALVASTNQYLELTVGLAKYLSREGGPSLQADCTKRVQQGGPLKAGDVFSVAAGNLPCQIVFFAVPPIWRGGGFSEAETLQVAIRKCLKEASTMNMQSIAIPAVGVGNKIPENIVVDTIVQAVMELEHQRTVLKEVVLIDVKHSLAKKFSDSMASVAGTSGGKAGIADMGYIRENRELVKTKEGITVRLVKGSIAKQKADIIVNTTARDLNLHAGGAVSKSIMEAAGPDLQKECSDLGGVGPGSIAITEGYKMHCKKIYHGTCTNWNRDKQACEMSISQFLKTCLRSADRFGSSSIAFPAIGTGANHVPPDRCAKIMLQEVAVFSSNKPASIKEIIFVVYDKDRATIDGFEAVLATLKEAPPGRIRNLFASLFGGPQSEGEVYVDNRPGFSGPLGNVSLHMRVGDITNQSADAIVNSTNADLKFTEGIARIIAHKAGQSYLEECKSVVAAGGMKKGLAVTGGGDLKVEHVIQVVMPTKAGEIRKALDRVMAEACKQKFSSIAFPALGTELASASKTDMADVLLEAIKACTKKKTTLKDVTIIVYCKHPENLEVYKQTIAGKTGADWKKLQETMSKMSAIRSKINKTKIKPSPPVRAPAAPSSSKGSQTLRMCADTTTTLHTVVKNIDGISSKFSIQEVMKSPKDKECIAALDDKQLSAIKELESKHSVNINVDHRRGHESITIDGHTSDVQIVKQCIMTIFAEAERKKMADKLAEERRKQVQWYFYEDDEWNKYDPEINDIIEQAHENSNPYAEWQEETGSFKVDFANKVEIPSGGAGPRVPVKRVEAATKLPPHWDDQKPEEIMKLVKLQATSNEYKKVDAEVKKTATGTVQTIKEISRVQNPSLLRKYKVHEETMTHTNPMGTVNETSLWHGTAADTVESICHNGFDRGYSGKNGTALGKGVYFAKNLSYSARYGVPDKNGDRHAFLCSVLTGMYMKGDGKLTVAPIRTGSVHYDSVVDDTTNPTIFVIFSDTQAYPEYLVKYV